LKTFFYRHPRATVLLLLLLLVDGLAGLLTLPRMEDPLLNDRAALIVTRFPGASAERVEALVTIPIEKELAEVEELKMIRTDSRPGLSTIVVEVKDELSEFISVWSRVRDALDDAKPTFPAGVGEPDFERREARAYAVIIALSWESEAPVSPGILARYGRELEDLLRATSGTEKVDLYGAPIEEIQVRLDPESLVRHRLTPALVAAQISAYDVKSSAGRLTSDEVDLLLEVPELETPGELSGVLVKADEEGRTIALTELATFERGEQTPPRDKVLIQGERSVVVAAKVLPAKRVDRWSADVNQRLEDFRKNLPEGMELQVLFDQSEFTAGRLRQLQRNVMMGAALVAISVFFAMGWRSALVISSALPLTTLVVLSVMKMLGVPIHQMSVTGLIIALGLLIDNAIVVTDELKQAVEKGATVVEGIEQTVSHLWVPLTSSTATTVLAFMPLVLMPGPAGEFVGSISITVISALLGSLFLSLTVIPVFYGVMRSRSGGGDSNRFWNRGISFGPLTKLYKKSLRLCYGYPVLGVAVGLVLPLAGFVASQGLQEQFFPPSDRGQCELTVELPPGTSLARTEKVTRRVQEFLSEQPEVRRVDWYLGRATPAFFYNLLGTRQAASNYAQAMVVLSKDMTASQLYGTQRRLQNDLDNAFPEARILVRQLEQGPPFEAPVEVQLYGPDLEVLRRLGDEVRLMLTEVPEVTHSQASLNEELMALKFLPDVSQVRISGLTSEELSAFLLSSTQGVIAGSLLEDTEQVQVRVRLDDPSRERLSAIQNLEPRPSLSIERLGELRMEPERAVITRQDRRRVNRVQGFLQSGVLPSIAVSKLTRKIEESDFILPPGYELKLGGEAAKRDEAVGNLLASAGTLLVLMCSTLVLGFSSFRVAGIIAAVAAASVGLSVGALFLFGYPFGFMAIIGAIGLVGIAINDSIVVLAAILANPQSAAGDLDTTVQVVVDASRHVFTTTATTIAGFLPLYLSGGSFWPPLAVAIAGGVAGATLLALYFAPAALRLLGCNKS
jgi:multidrug efflux pump subunit AcrB